MFKEKVANKLRFYQEDMKGDLAELIAIPSHRDLTTKKEGAPFGMGIRKCFDKIIEFAQREGFSFEDFDGYAIHVEHGKGTQIIGILCHIDTVGVYEGESWMHDPYDLWEQGGYWYGRGVNDNKGSVVGCLYLLKILKEMGYLPNKRIRLIIGGAEETTWECMEYYFAYSPMPDYGFSPDGDFPIINCEKGIGYYEYRSNNKGEADGDFNVKHIRSKEDRTKVCDEVEVFVETKDIERITPYLVSGEKVEKFPQGVRITYKGISSMGRNPHRGQNAIFKWVEDFMKVPSLDSRTQELIELLNRYFVGSIYGEKLGIYHEDKETGLTTSNLSFITLDNDGYTISFDYRYPKGIDYGQTFRRLQRVAEKNNLMLKTIDHKDLLYVPPSSPLILALQHAYKSVTGEKAELFSKGAASYARVLKNAVAFGPTFPGESPNSHRANECIRIETFLKALLIYGKTIKLLDEV